MNRRSQDAYDVLSEGNSGMYLPYSLRGAMYGNYTFPVDGEYEFRLRIANFRGESDADLTDEERARRAEERRKLFEARRLEREKAAPRGRWGGGAGARRRAGGRVGRAREPTPEELKARDEAARKGRSPSPACALGRRRARSSRPSSKAAARLAIRRGSSPHARPSRRASASCAHRIPSSRISPIRARTSIPDMRRGLFVDYLDIVGPFNPSKEPPASYKRIFICSQTTPQCARTILSNLMERAYRRPVTDEELESKVDLVALAQREGDTFQEGIRLALQAILASPNFLFRIEANPRPKAERPTRPASDAECARTDMANVPPDADAWLLDADASTEYPVSDVELASRLSYFLWASMPDAELMRVAKAGTLRKPAVLEAQVRRMMADPKEYNLVENWAAQWLQLRNLGRTKPDPKRFPTVDDELLDAMRKETSMFVETIIKEDRSLLDFIDAPFTLVNGPLARHYGIKGIDGEEFQRVDARRRAAQRRADAGRDPDRVLISDADVAAGSRQVGDGESARHAATAAARRCAVAE